MTDENPQPPPLPKTNTPFEIAPMEGPASFWNVVSSLLKQPGRVWHELLHGRAGFVWAAIALAAAVSLAIYGVVAGSLSGGQQMWIAPAKILLGSLAAALICLPSLFVFLCMSGADVKIRQVVGLLLANICLMAVLLVSLAPIAWVFSQSTENVAFMAALHLMIWSVALGFGLRLLGISATRVWGAVSGRLGLWAVLYIVVCLQMMTALRPIIGQADSFLPKEKRFFLVHWAEVLGASGAVRD